LCVKIVDLGATGTGSTVAETGTPTVPLWRIALVRMHCHQPTKDYVARRTAEGRTKKEILRCLKRCIAREAYPLLIRPSAGPYGRGSTPSRSAA